MLKITYAGCLGLSPAISAKFTFEMRVTARNHKKLSKTHISGVQGHLRSSMLTFLKSSSLVLVTIKSISVPSCNHCHAKRDNISKIMSFCLLSLSTIHYQKLKKSYPNCLLEQTCKIFKYKVRSCNRFEAICTVFHKKEPLFVFFYDSLSDQFSQNFYQL